MLFRSWSNSAQAQCESCGEGAGILGNLRAKMAYHKMPVTYRGSLSDVIPPQRCGYRAPRYPVPYATPSVVGSSQFTYPPMMPHHSLPHYRHIYSYRHAPGLARTNVAWTRTPGDLWRRVAYQFELPR